MKNKRNDPLSAQNKLLEDIRKTRVALDTAYRNFQCVSDPDLIDCYIYEMNSVDLRYKYLINQLNTLKAAQHT